MGDFELGIGVFRIGEIPNPQSLKHQSPIKNQQLVILLPICDFHFQFSFVYCNYKINMITSINFKHVIQKYFNIKLHYIFLEGLVLLT